MKKETLVVKPYINKRTKQLTVSIPKKKLKLVDPTIKFGDDLFVSISPFNKRRK